jgi:hypothetical protein
MTRETVCPACGRTLRVPAPALGQSVECPACGAVFTAAPAQPRPPEARAPDSPPDAPAPPPADEAEELAEDDFDEPPPEGRPLYALHPPVHVAFAALASLFSPLLAGGVILALNYVALRRFAAAAGAVLAGLAGEVVLTAVAVSDRDNTRSLLLSLLGVPLMLLVALALQGSLVREHLAAGGRRASLWVALGVGGGCLLLSLAAAAVLAVWFPALVPTP